MFLLHNDLGFREQVSGSRSLHYLPLPHPIRLPRPPRPPCLTFFLRYEKNYYHIYFNSFY